jgi:SAM-dependent methyltransferase
MSHPEQVLFVKKVLSNLELTEKISRVLEVGSADVYGTIRSLFSGAEEYIGVDLAPGPGVDVVASGHDLPKDIGKFDISISCEVFEHDPDWKKTIQQMVFVTNPGGLLIITCAGPRRPEHGTQRTNATESPGTQEIGWDYYQNVTHDEILDELKSNSEIEFNVGFYNHKIFDTYVIAVKKSNQSQGVKFKGFTEIDDILEATPFLYVLLRWPIRIAYSIFPYERAYSFSWKYWTTLDKFFNKQVRRT